MLKDVYVFLEPCDMDAENPKNYHVIKAKQDDSTGALSYPYGNEALCERWKKKHDADIRSYQVKSVDDSKMRTFLAEKQNDGNEVCANCVKHFYADD